MTAAGDDAPPPLKITDFLDLATLQDVQERFTALTGLRTVIRDADGNELGTPAPGQVTHADRILEQLIVSQDITPDNDATELTAPIEIDGQKLGSISIQPLSPEVAPPPEAAQEAGRGDKRLNPTNKVAAVQFLYLMANTIARRCMDQHQMRRRIDELTTLYRISTLMASTRNIQELLDTAARSAAQAVGAKAASIRLLDDAGEELVLSATFNLSEDYLRKGPILVRDSRLFRETFEHGLTYIADMATDDRVHYPEDARREGLVSMLNVAMVYKGRPVGVLRVYTGTARQFEHFEVELLRALAQLLATAIQNARLSEQRAEALRVQRQLRLAADVQRRMLPAAPPALPPFDIAARYVSSFELGGDFYDFIDLDGHLGVAVADVVGKGVAASLLMASVRASLRAYAQDVYDLDEVISRVNSALVRDTLDNEFATIFYGVLDPGSRRLTYCNAGHDPALLLRGGRFQSLDIGGMIVGIDERQQYEKGLVNLEPGDLLLIYTDGLTEAANFDGEHFGKDRVKQAMLEARSRRMSAAATVNHILWEMRRFTGLNRNRDDLTLVAVKVGKTK